MIRRRMAKWRSRAKEVFAAEGVCSTGLIILATWVEREGATGFDPPPLTPLRTGGGDGCRHRAGSDGTTPTDASPGSSGRSGNERCRGHVPFWLSSTEPQCDEPGALARFHAQENGMFAALLC